MNAPPLPGIFSRGLALLQAGRHEEALVAMRDALRTSDVLPELRAGLEFSTEICERRMRRATDTEANSLVVGIVAPAERSKGLFRDAETIVWALQGAEGLRTSVLLVSNNLYRHDHVGSAATYEVMGAAGGAASRTTAASWLEQIDVLIVLEALNPSLLALAQSSSRLRQILFMPNLEWAVIDPEQDDTRSWERYLQSASTRVVTIARSPSIQRRLAPLQIPTVLLNWSIPDPVVDARREPWHSGREVRMLFNGGNLGFQDRRGLDILLDAIGRLGDLPGPAQLVIKCNKAREELATLQAPPGLRIEIDTRFVKDREDVLAYYDRADLVLYPSRFEGLGLSLLEALHRGCYVLATDGEPMTDLLPAAWLRIPAQRRGLVKLAPRFEPDPRAMADAMRQLLLDPEQLLTDTAADYRERQARFRRELASLVRLLARADAKS